jgi:hypothetical protein
MKSGTPIHETEKAPTALFFSHFFLDNRLPSTNNTSGSGGFFLLKVFGHPHYRSASFIP